MDRLAGPMVIGNGVWGGTRETFTGEVDDVRIYDRALSGEEVKALYEMEKP